MTDCCPEKAEARKYGMFEGPVGDDWYDCACKKRAAVGLEPQPEPKPKPKSPVDQYITRVKVGGGLRIAFASILDGFIGVFTLGAFIGSFRHKASLGAARRASRKRKDANKTVESKA